MNDSSHLSPSLPVQRSWFTLLLAALLVLLAACSPAAETAAPTAAPTARPAASPTPGRYIEATGGFSYFPPSGWRVAELAGLQYKIAVGPTSDDFSPNLVIVSEANTGTLAEYLTANKTAMAGVFSELEFLSEAEFLPAEGEAGIKLVFESQQNNQMLHQVVYFFDAGESKVIVTYTRLVAQGETNDALVDESMRTFRFEGE